MKPEDDMPRSTFLRKALGAAFGLAARLPLALPEAEAVEAETVEAVGAPVRAFWSDGGYSMTNSGTTGVFVRVTSGGEWLNVTTA